LVKLLWLAELRGVDMGLPDDAEYFVGALSPSKGVRFNHGKLFTPASNTKILTSWFSLNTLGEDYEFYSEYSICDGTLYLRCRGNPLLGVSDINELIDQLYLPHCLQSVVLDTGYLNTEGRPPGWCFDDTGEGYAPVVSDVCFNLNRVGVEVRGEELIMDPPNSYFKVCLSRSAVKPLLKGRRVKVPASRLASGGKTSFSYPSPPRFLLEYVAETLRRKGLVNGRLRLVLGRLRGTSTPFAVKKMGEVLRTLNKHSENIVAELLLLHSGKKLGADSLGLSLKKLHEELEKISITRVRLYDGSGLSRYNLVSPEAIVRVLEILQDKRVFLESLPVGSVDGTLSKRLNDRVRAKTGSLQGVRALSGYAGGECFSIIVNHCVDTDAAVRLIDEFVVERLLA